MYSPTDEYSTVPTVNRSFQLADGATNDDVLQGTVIQSLGPGIWSLKVKAAADADVEHTLKADTDLAIDDGVIFPNLPLNPLEDGVWQGAIEGGSNLLYNVSNNTGGVANIQVQFEAERMG